MAKNLKLNIKNTQLQKALKLKGKLGKEESAKEDRKKATSKSTEEPSTTTDNTAPPKRKIRARTRSAFAPTEEEAKPKEEVQPVHTESSPLAETKKEAESPPRVLPPPEAEDKKAEPEQTPPEEGRPRVAPKRAEPSAKAKQKIAPKRPATEPPPSSPKKPFDKKKRTFRDVKPKSGAGRFDARDRKGLRTGDDERWRKRRSHKPMRRMTEETTIRPSELTVRLPISIKDLSAAMKLKASQLIGKLLMQGVAMTLNDVLEDETTIQLLGHEFGCEIAIDTTEEERLRITNQSIQEEIAVVDPNQLQPRAPVVTFMGHVDHGKTSLIDRIRETNVASQEAGAITQHIGAFQTQTAVGPITILDTPGHEAFTAMRARGADVTDVVVLVIAGDEGIRPQTKEAIQHAQAGSVTLMVAINKCDKPGFNAENVYRQLSELELMPEAWGGSVVTVNCSAVTGEGMDGLLEMIALQTEVLELRGNPKARARGAVLESQMHKGLGAVATVLVQNGTLHHGDAVVFDTHWGRVKTMQDEFGKHMKEAGPAMPIAITGLSGLPSAGSEFIVVPTEKEARDIAEARQVGERQRELQKKRRISMESLLEHAQGVEQKQLNLILRADVQGSLEALKQSLSKVGSEKARIEIIFSGVGAVSESDVELAIASNAVIIGFHTQVESHADELIRQGQVQVRTHDVIYHAIDDVKALLTGKLEKVAQKNDMGAAEIRAIFKASQLGTIAGCYVTEGTIHRNHYIRQKRKGETLWEGTITSIRREQDDVKEIKAGLECGILLNGQNDLQEGDLLESYEIVYISQEL